MRARMHAWQAKSPLHGSRCGTSLRLAMPTFLRVLKKGRRRPLPYGAPSGPGPQLPANKGVPDEPRASASGVRPFFSSFFQAAASSRHVEAPQASQPVGGTVSVFERGHGLEPLRTDSEKGSGCTTPGPGASTRYKPTLQWTCARTAPGAPSLRARQHPALPTQPELQSGTPKRIACVEVPGPVVDFD